MDPNTSLPALAGKMEELTELCRRFSENETPINLSEQELPSPSAQLLQSQLAATEDRNFEPLPARALNEFVYCPRLFYYEFVEGIFVESADTLRGASVHRRVDTGYGSDA